MCVVRRGLRFGGIVPLGDRDVAIGEVTEAYVMKPPAGRADAAILELKQLGDIVYHGG